MSVRALIAAVAGALLLTGCTAVDNLREVVVPPDQPNIAIPAPTEEPDDDVEVIVVPLSPEPVTPSATSTWREYKPVVVTADPAAFAEFDCREPTEAESAEFYRRWGSSYDQTVLVDVGEGLEPGSEWSVFAFRDENNNRYVHFADRPGTRGGTWIILSSVKTRAQINWSPVKWEREDLARAQAAAERALDCLESE